MGANKSLVPTRALKTHLLKEERHGVHVYYDKMNDTLLMQIIPPDKETIVHFLDDENVSLLYEARSKEVVGIQIEEFKAGFLPKHAGLEKMWNKRIGIRNFGELLIRVEDERPLLAREIVKASRPAISQNNERLAKVFHKSFETLNNYASVVGKV